MVFLKRSPFFFFSLILILSSCGQTQMASNRGRSGIEYRQQTASKPKRQNAPLIVIDAGHGGFDLGAHTRGCEEKEVCLKTAFYLRKNLEAMGYKVVMTRTRDEFIPLKKRAEIANNTKCQALVSLHYNAARNHKAKGIEIFYADKAEPWRQKRSKMLAQSVLSKLLSATGAESRGVKEGNFCVIRETKMPSILVEGGFITNEDEEKRLTSDAYIKQIAASIAEGIELYFSS